MSLYTSNKNSLVDISPFVADGHLSFSNHITFSQLNYSEDLEVYVGYMKSIKEDGWFKSALRTISKEQIMFAKKMDAFLDNYGGDSSYWRRREYFNNGGK